MEKHTQDKSSVDDKSIPNHDPNDKNRRYGDYDEQNLEKDKPSEKNMHVTPRGTRTGDAEKSYTDSGLNEGKSTVSNTSAPSQSISEKNGDEDNGV